MISSPKHPENHLIYSVETNLGYAFFCNDISNEQHDELEMVEEKWCNIHFDGAVNKEGARVGICITGPKFEYRSFSYKFYFDCMNNVVEYEAIILGLKMIKELKIKKVSIYGDSELVVNQVKGIYQAKHLRMRAYRNVVLDLLQDIPEYQFMIVPREQNVIENAIAVSASLFKILIYPNKKYEIQVKHKTGVPDNLKYWQVFEDGQQLKSFITTTGEFENCFID